MICSKNYNILIGLIIATLLFSIKTYSQNRSINNIDPNQSAFTSPDPVFTINGNLINKSNNSKIDENALLYPCWQKGLVYFNNGKQLRDVELELNLVKNELYFKNNNVPNLFVDTVTSFFIIDKLNGSDKIVAFRNGYPNFQSQTNNTFYQILASGKRLHLLKYLQKKKREAYDYSYAKYEMTEELFVYDAKNNSIKVIKNNIASINNALPEYAIVRQNMFKNKNGKHLTDEEITVIINQINEIQQNFTAYYN